MIAKSPIRIMVVDDHPIFRDGLLKYIELEDDMQVVADCDNGNDALENARATQPDVVILDVNLPIMNGLQVTKQLKTNHSSIAIVVLTAYHDVEQVINAMRAGAAAYCAKDIHPDRLLEIIRDVAAGYFIVGDDRMTADMVARWIAAMVENYTGGYTDDSGDHYVPLSPREMEILRFVTTGMSNKQIAYRLSISQQTVKNHMTSILRKLNVDDRTQAAVTALKRGWVRLQDSFSSSNLM